jgi:hypothetical protein
MEESPEAPPLLPLPVPDLVLPYLGLMFAFAVLFVVLALELLKCRVHF